MKLKLDAEGRVVLSDGKPVYVHDDGKEIAFDAAGAFQKIAELGGEARRHREAKEAAEARLKAFDGIEDVAAARKALDVVKNLDAKKLVDAGEVEKIKAEAIKALEERYAPVAKKAEDLEAQLYSEKIGGAFARSKFISERIAVPPDMIQSTFGQRFRIEEGKVVAFDASGNKLFSRVRPGEVADFDEALELLVDAYPHRDHILKGRNANGSGATGSATGSAGSKTMTRAAFDALPPAERAAKMSDGYKLTDA